MRLLALCLIALSLSASPASAQELFANPFATAREFLTQRGASANATFRARYEQTIVERAPASTTEVIVDVASDWALVRRGPSLLLYDFRLGRLFDLSDAASFTATNQFGALGFRVMERQNRTYLGSVLGALGPDAAAMAADGCDAETELALAIPELPDAGRTERKRSRGRMELECNDRAVGAFEWGDDAVPPPAFWPMMATAMPTHPALFAAVQETGHAPRRLEASYRAHAGGALSTRSWRLIAIEVIDAPYPLSPDRTNVTAQHLDDAIGAGFAQLAVDAVAGRALGSAPTLESWDAHLRALAATDQAAAALEVFVGLNAFPGLDARCPAAPLATCAIIRRLPQTMTEDNAVRALMTVIVGEQTSALAPIVAAMTEAKSSPHANHPVLGASFALALLKGDRAFQDQARAAGLPTDPTPLTIAAVRAYPYNPAYWTDLGDLRGANYDFEQAYLFYDIAFSLPVPGAGASNVALNSKKTFAERLQRDFPAFFLPQ